MKEGLAKIAARHAPKEPYCTRMGRFIAHGLAQYGSIRLRGLRQDHGHRVTGEMQQHEAVMTEMPKQTTSSRMQAAYQNSAHYFFSLAS